jgi:hypothetical protein
MRNWRVVVNLPTGKMHTLNAQFWTRWGAQAQADRMNESTDGISMIIRRFGSSSYYVLNVRDIKLLEVAEHGLAETRRLRERRMRGSGVAETE